MLNVQVNQQANQQAQPSRGIKGFFEGWTKFEKIWILIFTLTNIALWFVWKDNLLGVIATFTGMMANVLVAKGRISNYAFGLVNVLIYGYISWGYQLYGEAMLNLGFYSSANIIGFFMWRRNLKKPQDFKVNGEDIKTRRLTKRGWVTVLLIALVASIVYAEILTLTNAQQVRLDSFAVVFSIIAQVLMLMRYTEQWILWILVNVLSIALWVVTLIKTGGTDYAMITMWTAYLINAIYGYVNWAKISKQGVDNNDTNN